MRLIICLLAFVSVSFSCFSQEQKEVKSNSKPYKNTLYTSVLSPAVKTLNVSYERFLNQRFSARITFIHGSIYPQGDANRIANYFRFSGGTAEVRKYTRIYPGKPAVGFYFGPYIQYFQDVLQDYKFSRDSGFVRDTAGGFIYDSQNFSVLKGGFMAGNRQVFLKRLVLDMNAGIHYQSSNAMLTSSEIINLMAHKGFSFKVGMSLGFCF